MPIGIGQEATYEISLEAPKEIAADGLMKGLLQDNRFSPLEEICRGWPYPWQADQKIQDNISVLSAKEGLP
jgi:hypothetical protein